MSTVYIQNRSDVRMVLSRGLFGSIVDKSPWIEPGYSVAVDAKDAERAKNENACWASWFETGLAAIVDHDGRAYNIKNTMNIEAPDELTTIDPDVTLTTTKGSAPKGGRRV